MPLWGIVDNANNQPKYVYNLARTGPLGNTKANQVLAANNLFNNVNPVAFGSNAVIGSFAVTAQEFANTSAPEWAAVAHIGWNMRIAGCGPLTGAAATGGSGFANGETVTIKDSVSNQTQQMTLTSNATGNLVSATPIGTGVFANVTNLSTSFDRELHLSTITIGAGGTGYANTDKIQLGNGVINATATLTTNATGGITATSITGLGLWSNVAANASVTFSYVAANGGASAGSGATLTANLVTSTGGTVNGYTLGGRANRVLYECIVAGSSITSTSNTIPG